MLKVTAVVRQTIKIIEGEYEAYLGVLLPTMAALMKNLEEMRARNLTYCTPLIKQIIESVNTR